ncbi:MAG: TlpA family protein disulfide reductase [Desulfobacterota bacterium]|nr:TlpA family protein disulfide reductase [Thermodesulfobacteriota bacterium]
MKGRGFWGRGWRWLLVGALVLPFFSPQEFKGLSRANSKTNPCENFGIHRLKKEPPPFSLKSLEGKEVSLKDYKGKPVLLFFWGSWCQACKEDLALLEKFGGRSNLQMEILTIAVDGEKERRIRSIVKEYRITLPVLLDQKEKTARAYGVRMIPTAYLINQEGWMEGMIVGQREWHSSEAQLAIREALGLH